MFYFSILLFEILFFYIFISQCISQQIQINMLVKNDVDLLTVVGSTQYMLSCVQMLQSLIVLYTHFVVGTINICAIAHTQLRLHDYIHL